MHLCNRHILDALELARELADLAHKGEEHALDDSCAVLYGVISDCAHKIRQQAEFERERHIDSGIWDGLPDEKSG